MQDELFGREQLETVLVSVARRVADPDLAADLTAEVLLAATGTAPRRGPMSYEWLTWLTSLVVAERPQRALERPSRPRLTGCQLLNADDLRLVESLIRREAPARERAAAMARLPWRQRVVLELTAVDGLSASQVAAVLGIRRHTVRCRLRRARAAVSQS